MKQFIGIILLVCLTGFTGLGQADRWQQRISYTMDIDMDAEKHQFAGYQKAIYQNNSPDTLDKVFYHLYFNAFQPGSMMDVRSRTIADPDRRVGDRILNLEQDEIGYHVIKSLRMNGEPVSYEVVGTILEVQLLEPILPQSSATFEMEFESQVPKQIRRSGRDNKNGIEFSMAQWYPKMCEYDYQGWHANPYVAREFYGIWGDFDVTIHMDKSYIIGGTGYLQNPEEIGYGYIEEDKVNRPEGDKLTWRFLAPNVHDFVWAADPDYIHKTFTREDGMIMHFYYQADVDSNMTWSKLPEVMDVAFDYINEHFGQYPYKQYSFIQGGDGGMEYPMATLLRGDRSMRSLIGVSVHELMHSWYQMVLGSNESLYPWMDEGFTNYAEVRTMNHLAKKGLVPGKEYEENPFEGEYVTYIKHALSGLEEPMSVHSDHYVTNRGYGRAAYTKGCLFMHQLEYIIGTEAHDRAILKYFDTWKFKHPNANDVTRIFEKESGLELDWYKEYMVNTTHLIDHSVEEVKEQGRGQTVITLGRRGYFPMPVDLLVTYKDGRQQMFNIPLRVMRGNKPQENMEIPYRVIEDWPWTHPVYEFVLAADMGDVAKIEIDPDNRTADALDENDRWEPKKDQ